MVLKDIDPGAMSLILQFIYCGQFESMDDWSLEKVGWLVLLSCAQCDRS